MFVARYWMLVVRCRILDARCSYFIHLVEIITGAGTNFVSNKTRMTQILLIFAGLTRDYSLDRRYLCSNRLPVSSEGRFVH